MLAQSFFEGDTVEAARSLVGKYLVRQYGGLTLAARITETEAYVGRMDKACHAYGYRRTERTKTLYATPGTAYVYLIYGMHCCLNFVTEPEGEPAAVLIRGLSPRHNQDIIAENRFHCKCGAMTAYQRRGISLSAKELISSDALFFYPKTARGGGKMAGICLTLGKRREIERLYNDDMRPSEIAAAVGVTTATIYRELKRGETGELDKHFRPAYSAEAAERAVRLSIRNRGRRKAEK